MTNVDPVISLPRQSVRLSAITGVRAARATYLGPYHGADGVVACLCRPEHPIPMGVGYRTVPYETYYLYPLHRTDPARHAWGCPHRVADMRAGQLMAKPIVEPRDGVLIVHLATPMMTYGARNDDGRTDTGEAEPQTTAGPGPGGERPRGTLLTLLQVLWSQAGLNVWRPGFAGRRPYGLVRERMLEAASVVRVKGEELAARLLVPPTFRPDRESERDAYVQGWMDRLRPNIKGQRWYGVVVGLIRSVEHTRAGTASLALAHCRRRLWIAPGRWPAWARKWGLDRWRAPAAHPGVARAPAMLIALVLLEDGDQPSPWLDVRELAVMPIADTVCWIPADSEAERQVASRLVRERRHFRKPFAIELSGSGDAALDPDVVVPAFILDDRADRLHLDVQGRRHAPASSARWDDQRTRYARQGQAVWSWDPDGEPEMPALPAPSSAGPGKE